MLTACRLCILLNAFLCVYSLLIAKLVFAASMNEGRSPLVDRRGGSEYGSIQKAVKVARPEGTMRLAPAAGPIVNGW